MKIKAKIDRMVNAGNVKAIASVSLDGMFVVKNLKVMDGKKGLFVSMPQDGDIFGGILFLRVSHLNAFANGFLRLQVVRFVVGSLGI